MRSNKERIMEIREGDLLEVIYLGQMFRARALNTAGPGERGVLVRLMGPGRGRVKYVPFGIVDDEREVGEEPRGGGVPVQVAGFMLLGTVQHADLPASEADGKTNRGGGADMLAVPNHDLGRRADAGKS